MHEDPGVSSTLHPPPKTKYPSIVRRGPHDPPGSQVTAGAGRGDSGHRVEAELCCAGGWSHWHIQGRGLRLRPHLPQKARRRDRRTDRQIEGMNGETIRQESTGKETK